MQETKYYQISNKQIFSNIAYFKASSEEEKEELEKVFTKNPAAFRVNAYGDYDEHYPTAQEISKEKFQASIKILPTIEVGLSATEIEQ